MKSTVTVRGQTAIPAEIRRRYNIKPNAKLEWIDDGHTIAVLRFLNILLRYSRGDLRI